MFRSLGWFRRASAATPAPVGDLTFPSPGGAATPDDQRRCAAQALDEGETLLARGQFEAALAAFQSGIDCGDQEVAGHIGQAQAYLGLGRTQDAADSLEVALAIDPTECDALVLLARIRREAGALEEALDLLRRAQRITPGNVVVLANLASALNRSGDIPGAVAAYSEAIRVAPSDPRPKINLGMIYLQECGDPCLAESYFRSALAEAPYQVEATANLGLALHDQGRYDEELEHYRQAQLVHPESTELRWNEALAHLSAGNLSEGWRGYELRFTRPEGRDLSRFPFPAWDGSPIPDARLLLLAEQGLGDEVMFASCIPDLVPVTKGIVLECAPRLAPLFARSFPEIEVHGRTRDAPLDWLDRYPDIGAQVPVGSLPMRLRPSLTAFPRHGGYLRADLNRVHTYRKRMTESGQGLCVGISWRGGTAATRTALRSIALTALDPLLSIEGVQFVCLQHHLSASEKDMVRERKVALFDDALADIDELAALTTALDLVITVGNLNLHMAGALGRPAWGLLGMSPDWRWLREGANSLWYPSVVLYRARDYGGWEPMLEDVVTHLNAQKKTRC